MLLSILGRPGITPQYPSFYLIEYVNTRENNIWKVSVLQISYNQTLSISCTSSIADDQISVCEACCVNVICNINPKGKLFQDPVFMLCVIGPVYTLYPVTCVTCKVFKPIAYELLVRIDILTEFDLFKDYPRQNV